MEKKAITDIIEWIKCSHAHLSTSTEYAKGYRDGIVMAKEIIKVIIKDAGIEVTY